jgi:hypothetical protein
MGGKGLKAPLRVQPLGEVGKFTHAQIAKVVGNLLARGLHLATSDKAEDEANHQTNACGDE